MDNILAEQIGSERAFLHDMSNQLVIAQGMTSFVVSSLEGKLGPEFDKEKIKLEKSLKALNKMITLLRDRREELVQKDICEINC